MMNAEEFIKSTDDKAYYIESFLKLIVFSYFKLIDSKKTYSRGDILDTIKRIQNSANPHNEIEDYLCDDLVIGYIRPNKNLFGLDYFTVETGVKESKENVKVGILDIKFSLATTCSNNYYIFEAKRINKYSSNQDYYIQGGIKRFTDRIYYAESDITFAGMVGFVEVDLAKFAKGKATIKSIHTALNKRVKESSHFTTTQDLKYYALGDSDYSRVNDFEYTYQSKHLRNDNVELQIHHLLLDYYDILTN